MSDDIINNEFDDAFIHVSEFISLPMKCWCFDIREFL